MNDSRIDPTFNDPVPPHDQRTLALFQKLLIGTHCKLEVAYGKDTAFTLIVSRPDLPGGVVGSSFIVTNTNPIDDVPFTTILTNDDQLRPIIEAIEKITTGIKIIDCVPVQPYQPD